MNKMTARFRLLVVLAAALLLLLGAGGVAAALPGQQGSVPLPPAFPYSPWGTVTVNGSPAAAGTEVKAAIVGAQLGRGVVALDGGQAWYTLDVPADDPTTSPREGGVAGDKVSFTVGEYPTCYTRPWAGENTEQVDLVAITQADFADVPLSDWGFCSVRQIYQGKLTTGCNGGQQPLLYCPDSQVTRREMAVFIVRGLGLTPCTDCEQHFADVPPSDWAFGWIERFYEQGITTGCNGGQQPLLYCPDGLVTRREMAVFLVRAMGLTPCTDCQQHFADVLPSDWGFGWIERFYEKGITTGCNGGQQPLLYCPDGRVTRREMAVFLARTFYPQ